MVCFTSAFGQVIYVCERDSCRLGRATGIDGEHGAGDIPCLIAEEELDGVGNIIDVGLAAQCAAPHDLGALLVSEITSHPRIDKAGRHGIDVYAQRSDFSSEGS